MNGCGQPLGTEGFAGAIPSESNTALVTVSNAEDDFPERFAVIVAGPGATDVARPAGSIVATEGFVEVQVADEVIS